jgi:hypothetical protein
MDPIVDAIKELSNLSLNNDQAILEVLQKLIKRFIELENKVEMLMELHRAGDDDARRDS